VFVIFAVIAFIVNWVFTQITIGAIINAVYTGGSFGITAGIILAIGGAIGGFIYLWYVGALNEMVANVSSKKNVDYVASITAGAKGALGSKNGLYAVLGLGFLSGLIGGTGLLGYGYATSFVAALFIAAYTGVALVAYAGSKGLNFVQVFQNVNKSSSNAGLFLFLTVLVALLGFLSLYVLVLVFIMTPIAVVILKQNK
jgi:hypothetical protein